MARRDKSYYYEEITLVWDVMPFSPLDIYRYFGELCGFHIHGPKLGYTSIRQHGVTRSVMRRPGASRPMSELTTLNCIRARSEVSWSSLVGSGTANCFLS
jgi:hypothetical protein